MDIIEVSDDGIGIASESHPYIALPHATSKIRHFTDIYTTSSNTTGSSTSSTQPFPHTQQHQQNRSPTTNTTIKGTSFGFRGEALHCLANISEKLIVATRTCNDRVATKLEFNIDGTIHHPSTTTTTTTTPAKPTTISRKIGTTVAVMKLFFHLPVRYKDFVLHIKEQRLKLVQMIIGYALFLSPLGIRFHIMDIHNISGKEKSLFITPYYPSQNNVTLTATAASSSSSVLPQKQPLLQQIALKDSVSSILGCHLLHSLSDITIDLTSYVQQLVASTTNDTINSPNDGSTWVMKGLISTMNSSTTSSSVGNTSSNSNSGMSKNTKASLRSTTNTTKPVHYFAINHRPVDLPIISRLINKLYRRVCASSTTTTGSNTTTTALVGCTCIMELMVPLEIYDINLSPDKRKVQFWNDALLYELIERALIDFWTCQLSNSKNNNAAVVAAAASVNDNDTTGSHANITLSIPVSLPVSQSQQKQPVARRNTSFSCGKASLVTANSVSSSNQNINNNNNGDDNDDDESITAFDCISNDGPALHRRQRNSTDLRNSLSSSFHSTYSMDSTTTNRSFNRRYAFVHDPQQSIRKQQEYDNFFDHNFSNTSNDINSNESQQQLRRQKSPTFQIETPQPQSTTDTNGYGFDDELDQKPKSIATSSNLHIDSDRSDGNLSANNGGSSLFLISDHTQSSMNNNSNNTGLNISNPTASNTNVEYQEFQKVQEKFRRRSDSSDSISLMVQQLSSSKRKSSSSLLGRFGYQMNPTDASTTAALPEPDILNVNHETMRQRLESTRRQRPTINNEPQQDRDIAEQYGKGPVHVPVQDNDCQTVIDNDETPTAPSATVLWPGISSNDVVLASMQDRIATIRRRKRQRLDVSNTSPAIEKHTEQMEETSTAAQIDTQPQNERINTNYDSTNQTLTKEDLQRMTVIGQFNLGFIIAMTPDNNLWILDQHACDERFQFETLQKQTTKLFEQPLIAPLPLELSYMEEGCIIDNMEVFEQNGFRLQYDETKPSRHRFSLLAVPHSGAPDGRNAVQYGKQDVQDLCTILLGRNNYNMNDDEVDDDNDDIYSYNIHGGTGTDGTGLYGNNAVRQHARSGGMTMSLTQQSTVDSTTTGESTTPNVAEQIITRLPKTIAMFASRACRNSIMIGKALSTKEMEKVVQHLSSVDTPWICAHGRPTICHLQIQQQQHAIDLSTMIQIDERRASEHIAGPTITCLSQPEEEEYIDDDEDNNLG